MLVFRVLLCCLALINLPSCRCLGDGAFFYSSLRLNPSTTSTQAGGAAITIIATGEIYCSGQLEDIKWRLEPQLGALDVDIDKRQATYTPPSTLSSTTTVRVIADYPGQNGQRRQTETSLEVQKP
jgi:hypothetical protein